MVLGIRVVAPVTIDSNPVGTPLTLRTRIGVETIIFNSHSELKTGY
jgi:hypothetical protein